MTTVIALGNPGAGKSCILNMLANKVIFRCGVNIGEGLTEVFDVQVAGNTKFCDTPGLSEGDKLRLHKAGDEIRKSLNRGGPHKILFFVQQNAGRPVLEDQTTMRLIHEAAKEIGDEYGVIVNKVSETMLKKFANVENDIRFREKLFAGFPATDHVLYLPELDELKDKDDQLVEIDDVPGFKDFFNKIPIRNITKGSVEHIEVEKFEEMSNKIKELQKELENAAKSRVRLGKLLF